jgi:hypothetical protein
VVAVSTGMTVIVQHPTHNSGAPINTMAQLASLLVLVDMFYLLHKALAVLSEAMAGVMVDENGVIWVSQIVS